jgi:hypothetical protein
VALASLKAHIANAMRGKGGKVHTANDFLPPQWKVRKRQKPQTLVEAGILLIGAPPPWTKEG